MTSPPDFEAIDQKIEDLTDRLDRCHQAMLLSRAAIVVAFITLGCVLTIAGSYRTPTIVFSAIAAMIGGMVWLGANKSSQEEIRDELSSLDAVKDQMIDKIAAENGWRDLTSTIH